MTRGQDDPGFWWLLLLLFLCRRGRRRERDADAEDARVRITTRVRRAISARQSIESFNWASPLWGPCAQSPPPRGLPGTRAPSTAARDALVQIRHQIHQARLAAVDRSGPVSSRVWQSGRRCSAWSDDVFQGLQPKRQKKTSPPSNRPRDGATRPRAHSLSISRSARG